MVRLPAYLSNHISGMASSKETPSLALPVTTEAAAAPRVRGRLGKTSMAGLALTLGLIVTGCATSPDTLIQEPEPSATPDVVETPKEVKPPVAEAPDKGDPVQAQPDGQGVKQPTDASGMVSVSVYTIDDQCNDFVESTVQVPGNDAIEAAVGKAMDSVEYNAFKLADYDVSINGSTAIVDMQLAPGSERQFVSLSSCEQRSLFGSVEETLTNNPDWAVDSVKFTDNGKDLVL